jgi:hypothetical protein
VNEIYLLIYFLSPCAGLSEAEINLAVAKAKEINPALGMQVAHAPPTYASAPPLPVREVQVVHKRGWKDYTLAAVIIAGVSYVIVVFIKKYILNWFWRREEELDQKMSAMRDTLEQTREELTQAVQGIKEATQTMQEMTMQQRQLLTDPSKDGGQDNRRVLEEVKSDISSIKGLILGRSQFPSTPNVGGIPAWQKTATVSPSSPFEKVEMEEEIPLATEATNNSNQAAERITGKTDD